MEHETKLETMQKQLKAALGAISGFQEPGEKTKLEGGWGKRGGGDGVDC